MCCQFLLHRRLYVLTISHQIFELLQGRPLFRGRADESLGWTASEDRLALMMDLFGPLPKDLLRQGKKSRKYFDGHGIKLPLSVQDWINPLNMVPVR